MSDDNKINEIKEELEKNISTLKNKDNNSISEAGSNNKEEFKGVAFFGRLLISIILYFLLALFYELFSTLFLGLESRTFVVVANLITIVYLLIYLFTGKSLIHSYFSSSNRKVKKLENEIFELKNQGRIEQLEKELNDLKNKDN